VRLGRPAAEIGLGEVVRRIESDLALVPCMAPLDAPCRIRPCCALRLAMQRARAVFLETLDGYSLADLARPRGALVRALAIEPRRRNRRRRGRAGRVD
jgi:Rrf2 family nitric oxide-sensitive transcriptional repressor